MGTILYGYDEFRTWDEAVRYDLTGSKNGIGDRYRVIARSGRYYAVERIDEGIVTAVVALGSMRDRRASVKLVDENMGPYEAKAPAWILDLLSPTDSEYANEWREKCRANLAAKATEPKLTKGTRFRKLGTPVEFINGASASEFVYWGRYEASAIGDDGRRFAVSLPKTWRTDWKWEIVS